MTPVDVSDRPTKVLFRLIGAIHRRGENSSAFQIEVPGVRGTEGAGV